MIQDKNNTHHNIVSQENSVNYNQVTTNSTSVWSPCEQDDKSHPTNQFISSTQSFSNDQSMNQKYNITQQSNQILTQEQIDEKKSSSQKQESELLKQIQQQQEEINMLKKEKATLQTNFQDFKSKYEVQQKEHAREIAQLKMNMFNSVVESDNYSKDGDDDDDTMMRDQIDREGKLLVKSIEVDDKLFQGRFQKKENHELYNENASFSGNQDQGFYQLQKSNQSNINLNPNSVNIANSQEFKAKNHERMIQQNIDSNDKNNQSHYSNDLKNPTQFAQRNSLNHGTVNNNNTYKDNVVFLEVMEQLEQTKKENSQLKQELKIVKEELVYISSKDEKAHEKNEQLRIIEAKLRLEQDEEIMKYRIKYEELQSEIKKLNSLNKNLQNEIMKLKDGFSNHNRSSTIFDEKTLENLFDSEIESDQEDLEDDGYGDRDSKQIRKHKNDILNTMTHNEKIYNNIIYLKRKNRRLEDQLQEWKRRYWLLEKSTQNPTHHINNNHQQLALQQQNSVENKNSEFEFNFSQYLQFQKKASLESQKVNVENSKQQLQNNVNISVTVNGIQKQSSNQSSFSQRQETPLQCDTPAICISMNSGQVENYQIHSNESPFNIEQFDVVQRNGNINQNRSSQQYYYLSNQQNKQQNQQPYQLNQQHYQQNQQQNQSQYTQNQQHYQQNYLQLSTSNLTSKNDLRKSDSNINDSQILKQTPYNTIYLSNNSDMNQYDHQQSVQPVAQFSPSVNESQTKLQLNQSNRDFILDQIAVIAEEKTQNEKGAKTTIKDIRDQANLLQQKRKPNNVPPQQSHYISASQKTLIKPNQISSSQQQKIIYNPFQQSKSQKEYHVSNSYSKQYQSTSGLNNSTKISSLINNFKKISHEKQGSPKSFQVSKNLNLTSTSSNNTSQNMIICQTDRDILYTQQNASSPKNNLSQKLKTATSTTTTPRVLNAKHTSSIHQSSNQQQTNKSLLYQHPSFHISQQFLTADRKNSNQKNACESMNLSHEVGKPLIQQSHSYNNIGKSSSPTAAQKQQQQQSTTKLIEKNYSSNFTYEKTKFNQRIKDKYN